MKYLSWILWALCFVATAQTQYNIMAVTNQGQFVNANLNRGNCSVDFATSPPAFRCDATPPLPTAAKLGGLFMKSCPGKVVTGLDSTGNLICSPIITPTNPTLLLAKTDGTLSEVALDGLTLDTTTTPPTLRGAPQSASFQLVREKMVDGKTIPQGCTPTDIARNGVTQVSPDDFTLTNGVVVWVVPQVADDLNTVLCRR